MSSSIGQFTKVQGRRLQQDEGQVAVASTTTQIVAARSTRKAVVITNLDAAASVFIGENPALTSHYELEAGKSITLESPARIDGITSSGTVNVTYVDEYLGIS